MEAMRETKSMRASACQFTRNENSNLERGIAIDYGRAIKIVDSNGEMLEKVYDYHLIEYEGCFILRVKD